MRINFVSISEMIDIKEFSRSSKSEPTKQTEILRIIKWQLLELRAGLNDLLTSSGNFQESFRKIEADFPETHMNLDENEWRTLIIADEILRTLEISCGVSYHFNSDFDHVMTSGPEFSDLVLSEFESSSYGDFDENLPYVINKWLHLHFIPLLRKELALPEMYHSYW